MVIRKQVNYFLDNEFCISAISQIEIVGFWKLSKASRESVKDFLSTLTVIQTNPTICDIASKLRLTYNIKTPDAIIAATAKYLGFPLLTADEELFKIKEIEVVQFFK
jgi:predicted nucleic acid-binding protein